MNNAYLRGDFKGKEESMAAIKELKANGFTPADLAVFSDEPLEFPGGILDRPSHMSLLVVCGAITFFLLIVGFVYYTQYSYPLVTGGMPIFSFWPTGVVFYEITMLGAILTTSGVFLWESGLLRRDKRIPVPTVDAGIICLRVNCGESQLERTRELLSSAGAFRVEKLGDLS